VIFGEVGSSSRSDFQAVLHRWPSWAPRNEYAYMDVVKLAIPFLPTFGFPSLFKWAIGNVHIPIIRNAGQIFFANFLSEFFCLIFLSEFFGKHFPTDFPMIRNNESDRCGLLFSCQEQDTNIWCRLHRHPIKECNFQSMVKVKVWVRKAYLPTVFQLSAVA
jgi:hypothetical protein